MSAFAVAFGGKADIALQMLAYDPKRTSLGYRKCLPPYGLQSNLLAELGNLDWYTALCVRLCHAHAGVPIRRESKMTVVREPRLEPVAILDLRPTQITVGMREVKAKRERWRSEKKGGEFLGKHMIPVVLGPKHRHYVIDHHHLARALHDEGVKNVAVTVIANLSKLD